MEVLAQGPKLLHPGLPLLGHDGLVAATTHGAELPDNISTSDQGIICILSSIIIRWISGGWVPFDLRFHSPFYHVVLTDS